MHYDIKNKVDYEYYVKNRLDVLWLDTLHDDVRSINNQLSSIYINDDKRQLLTDIKTVIEVRLLEQLEKEFYSDLNACKNQNNITEKEAFNIMTDKSYYKDFGNYLQTIIEKHIKKEFKQ